MYGRGWTDRQIDGRTRCNAWCDAVLQILKTWPLTTVRRWAASPNSFTLVSTDSKVTHLQHFWGWI